MEIAFWTETRNDVPFVRYMAGSEVAKLTVCGTQPDFCSLLYRDQAIVGLFCSEFMSSAYLAIREFRRAEVHNPIFVLLGRVSAKHSDIARLLNAGADDVQPVTIDVRELEARLHALDRRDRGSTRSATFCGCTYFRSTGSVVSPYGKVHLTRQEAGVLDALMARPGAIITKEMLMHALYAGRDEPRSKIVDVFICKLRKKLLHVCGGLDVIETCWGRGFMFIPEGFMPKFQNTPPARVAG